MRQCFCPECLQAETCVCDRCGERIWLLDACCDETHTLCESCEAHYYTRCAGCGRLVAYSQLHYLNDDDDEGYCETCYNRQSSGNGIQSYSFKPEPVFYGDGTRYLGVELEIDSGGESNVNAEELLQIANTGEERAYCKHDGSLEDGFEIVTHPMTLAYHQESMP